jgi:4-aminobutyrate aminotransferase-like enzyme
VIKIRPPMPFDESNADFLVANIDRILKEDFSA